MFSKIIAVVCLATFSFALEQSYQHATSFASFNDNHNTVEHIHSSPQVNKPSSSHYSSPVYSAPTPAYSGQIHSAPAPAYSGQIHSSSQYSTSSKPASSDFQFASSSSGRTGEAASHTLPVFKAPSVAQYSAPVASHAASHQQEVYEPAKYEFAYGVEDHQTGDIHSHKESRNGDQTQGEYSLHEADGTIRTVKYTVDGHNGFNAVVERSGHSQVEAHQPIKASVAAPYQQYQH